MIEWMAALMLGVADPGALDRALEALLPPTVIEGQEGDPVALTEMMTAKGVPAVSIALVENDEIVAVRTFGMADVAKGIAATPDTRFQAASLSKPVSAYGAMVLSEEGLLDLDAPVNDQLVGWSLPHGTFAPVSVRQLLSHRGGTSVSGFPGYGAGETVPDVDGVLEGKGNTPAVMVTGDGSDFRYSGGGYTVVQRAMQDVAGQKFEEILAGRVLAPLGMTNSTFVQARATGEEGAAFARASDGSGAPIAGGWHLYPEQAAAGLWTTPTDLARFLIAANRSLAGADDAPVSSDGMRAMVALPTGDADYALGFGIGGRPGEPDYRLSHGGSNAGYKALMTTYPTRGDALVVMTSGDRGAEIFRSIAVAVAEQMGWGGQERETLRRADLDETAIEALVGGYALGDMVYRIERRDDGLVLVDPSGVAAPAVPVEGDLIFFPDDGQRAQIRRDDAGVITGVIASGTFFRRVP